MSVLLSSVSLLTLPLLPEPILQPYPFVMPKPTSISHTFASKGWAPSTPCSSSILS